MLSKMSAKIQAKVQGGLPILMSAGFLAAILGAHLRNLSRWGMSSGASATVFVIAYVIWIAVEARVAVKEISKTQTTLDRGTLELYAFGRATTVLVALFATDAPADHPLRSAAGGILFLGAVMFRLIAIRELGRFYSHRVRVADDHKIISTGPYRWIRHPAYTGMLLAHLGLVLFFFHTYSMILLCAVFVPAVVFRILQEERVLMSLSGYAQYSKSRARLLPGVW